MVMTTRIQWGWTEASERWNGRLAMLGFVIALATELLTGQGVIHQITALLDRHAAGDWGEISEDDRTANDEAARSGDGRLFSSFSTAEHGTLWVITDDIRGEGEGPITTVMFPEDY